MKILIATPDRNSRRGRHRNDFSGAFDPEARAFQSRRGGERMMVNIGAKEADRQRQVIAEIERLQPECFVWFGHGLERSIPQLGLDSDDEVARFTGAIAAACSSPILLFDACSMGDGPGMGGDGGIADRIRDGCVKHGAAGVRVYGHVGPGHTSMRPYVRVFQGPEVKPHNIGGRYVVEPPPMGSARRFSVWRAKLHGVLRFDYPFLTPAQLDEILEAA